MCGRLHNDTSTACIWSCYAVLRTVHCGMKGGVSALLCRMARRLVLQAAVVELGVVIAAGLFWGLVNVPESNVLALATSTLLALLVPQRDVGLEDALGAVGESARYDVYKVVDSALAGDAVRALRMLRGVRDEGADPIVIGWSAGRELRRTTRCN